MVLRLVMKNALIFWMVCLKRNTDWTGLNRERGPCGAGRWWGGFTRIFYGVSLKGNTDPDSYRDGFNWLGTDFFDKVCFKRNLPGGRQARIPIAIGTGLTDWGGFFWGTCLAADYGGLNRCNWYAMGLKGDVSGGRIDWFNGMDVFFLMFIHLNN